MFYSRHFFFKFLKVPILFSKPPYSLQQKYGNMFHHNTVEAYFYCWYYKQKFLPEAAILIKKRCCCMNFTSLHYFWVQSRLPTDHIIVSSLGKKSCNFCWVIELMKHYKLMKNLEVRTCLAHKNFSTSKDDIKKNWSLSPLYPPPSQYPWKCQNVYTISD